MDLWGNLPVESQGGKNSKDLQEVRGMSGATHGKENKGTNLDRGGEYQGAKFIEYLKSKGTDQKLNVHNTLQHAGVAEHHNRTIGEQI